MPMVHKGLAKLAEECGELLQIVGKKIAYPEGDHPDQVGDLDFRLELEMADVYAALAFVQWKMELSSAYIDMRVRDKLKLFKQWDKE